jgi:hypothetical protein
MPCVGLPMNNPAVDLPSGFLIPKGAMLLEKLMAYIFYSRPDD